MGTQQAQRLTSFTGKFIVSITKEAVSHMMVITGYTSTVVVFVASKGEQVITLKVNATLSIKSKKKSTFPVASGALNQLDLLTVS